MSYCHEKLTRASMDYALYQSQKGNYYIGETPFLSGQTSHALASLFNSPCNNNVLYVNAITITNPTNVSLAAEFYLHSDPINGIPSNQISCTNTSVYPEPFSEGVIEYRQNPTEPPSGGVTIFSRIVPPQSTLVVDGGQIILGQSQSLIVYIGGFSPVVFDNVRFAFGWWSDRACLPYLN